MATSRKSELVLTCNATAIKDVMKFLNSEMDKLIKKRDALLAKGEQNWSDKERSQFKKWGDDIAAITSMQQKNREEMVKFGQVMKDLANSKLRDLKKALNEGKNALNKMSENDPKRQKLINELDKIAKQIKAVQGSAMSMKEATRNLKDLGNVSFDRLKQGLDAINQRLTATNLKAKDRTKLQGFAQQYQAEIANRQAQTVVTNRSVGSMNTQQLRAEQAALSQAVGAMSGVKGYEKFLAQYEARLKAVNEQLKIMAQDEKAADQAAKELKATQEAAKTVQAVYRGQAASVEELEAAYKTLEARVKKYEGINPAKAGAARRNLQMIGNEIKRLNGELLTEKEIQDRVTNSGKYNVKELQQAYNQLDAKLKTLNSNEKVQIRQTKEQMAQLKKQIDSVTGAVSTQSQVWRTAVRNIGAYVGVFAVFNKLKSLFDSFVEKNKEFSDQMANVRKVSGLAMKDIAELSNRLAEVDSRTSLEGLMSLSYTGAKLGFGNYGIEGLEAFAKSAVKVQNALSEDMGEDAMTALSKLVEVMGLIPKMGVERAMDAAGSAIFKLASTSTATGTNIIEFTKRLMGLANVSHVATSELLALGSASDSMGLMAEVSATAFNKVFTSIQSNTRGIEEALKFTKGELVDLINQGRTMDAIVAVFEKMHGMSMDQLKAQGVFKALGSDGARLNNVMVTMSNRIDMLKEHLQTSNEAFEEGTAVAQEYAIQMDTAAAYSERAANIWNKAFVNPQGVDTVKEFTKAWYDVSKAMTSNKAIMGEIKFLLAGILELMKAIIYMAPALLNGLMFWGGARLGVWAKGALEINAMKTAVQGLSFSLGTLKKAWSALSIVGKANWIGAIATAVFMAIEAFGMFNKKVKEASGYMKGFKSDLSDLNIEYGKGEMELRRYRKAIDEATVGTKQRAAAIAQFNQKFKPYLSNLLTEKSTALDVAKAYQEITKQMRAKMALELREKDLNEQVMPREQWTVQRREEYDEAARAAGKGQYGRAWITGYAQDNQSKSIDAMVRDIGKRFYNLPEAVLKEVVAQASTGATKFNNWGNIINSSYLNDANALLAAGAYFRQDRSAVNARKKVMAKYESEDKIMQDYLLSLQKEEPIVPLDEHPTGDTGGSTSTDKDKELKDKFNETKKDVEGLIAKIDEWYNLQDAVVNEFMASGKISSDEADKALQAVKIARNTALMKARMAVATGDDKEWKKFYDEQMSKMMIDHGEWSTELFETIGKVDIETLHNFLASLKEQTNDPKVMAMLDASSFFDTMRKKSAESKKVIGETLAKAREELDKLLQKYDYFQQASLQFAKNLTQIGAIGTTAEQMAKGMEGVPDAKQTQDAVQSMMAAIIRQGASVYAIDPSDAQGVADMLRQATTEAMTEADYLAGRTSGQEAKWFDLFPAVKDWMANPEQHKQELEQLFNVMLIAEQDYYQKRKQSYQTAKTEQENRFRAAGYTDQENQQQTALSNLAKQKDAGIGASFMEQQGLGSIAQDPEVLAIQNRIYWRNEEVKAAQARVEALRAQQEQEIANAEAAGATLAELDQLRAEQAAQRMGMEDLLKEKQTELFEQEVNLSTKVAQELQKRVQTINSLIKPVTDFTQAAGRKIGDMVFNMESESATWEELWKNMALAVGESVIEMGAQYAQNLLMQQAMNRASETEAVADAGVKVTAGIAAGSAKTIGELGWWGIPLIAVISSLLMGLLQSALSTKSSKDGSSSSTTASTPKTKLVSGMLTYDKGNVQRFIGQDGRVYTATEEPQPKDGLVTRPIATTVQGQPALVAERGPEIVIGRETTEAIMMNEPELIRYIANYDRMGGRYGLGALRAYDSGNVGNEELRMKNEEFATAQNNVQSSMVNVQSDDLRQALDRQNALMEQVLYFLQNPVAPEINMYGDNGLRKKLQQADRLMSRYDG